MEEVKVQDIAANDLPWKIEYNAERCTMCGSCVASCTFKAIKVEIQRKSMTISQENQPEPVHIQQAIPEGYPLKIDVLSPLCQNLPNNG